MTRRQALIEVICVPTLFFAFFVLMIGVSVILEGGGV